MLHENHIDFKKLHSIVFPADVRKGDNVNAIIRNSSLDEKHCYTFPVWKLSPMGLELDCTNLPTFFSKGDSVEILLTVGSQTTEYHGVVVDLSHINSDNNILCIRIINNDSLGMPSSERRGSRRLNCSEQFLPSCVCQNPAKFNDFLYFRVRDISIHGMNLICSLRNKFLMPGLNLNLQISFPMVAQTSLNVTITRVSLTSEQGKDYFSIGVKYGTLDPQTKEIIGQYLIQFSNATSLKDLSEAGFYSSSISKAIDYTFVKDQSEYFEVIELRLLANQHAGKLSSTKSAHEMSDIYDTRSRIIIGKYDGKVVSTARLIFNEMDDLMEQEEFVRWPTELPRREEMVEVTRACTHPDFRGSDLLNSMFQHIALACLQAKRNWIVICTSPDLVPLYERIGFNRVGLQYENRIYKGVPQIVLLGNIPDGMLGRSVNPIYWNAVWKTVSKHILDSDLVQATGLDRIRLAIYRALSPISELLRYWKKKPRKVRR